jgi:ABC-type tungstate transport system permease subunit
LKRKLVACVLLSLLAGRAFGAGVSEDYNRVRIAECFNSPPSQFLLLGFAAPLGAIGTVPPLWKTLGFETPEDAERLEDTLAIAKFDIIITGNSAYAELLDKRGLVERLVPAYHETVILVGPAEMAPAMGRPDAPSAMKRIFSENRIYFSLLGDARVREAEADLMKSAGVSLDFTNQRYVETSRDDLSALFQAGDEGGFLLVGEASYAQYVEAERFEPQLVRIASTDYVRTTYACLLKNSGFRKIRSADAAKYMEWLRGEDARKLISDFRIGGMNPFIPSGQTDAEK